MRGKLFKTAKWACTAACALFTASLVLNALGYEFGWTPDGLFKGIGVRFGTAHFVIEQETNSPARAGATGFYWYRDSGPLLMEWWDWSAFQWGVQIPAWALVAAAGVSAAWLWRCDTSRPRPGLCPSCGYSLAGLSPGSKCPECGKGK